MVVVAVNMEMVLVMIVVVVMVVVVVVVVVVVGAANANTLNILHEIKITIHQISTNYCHPNPQSQTHHQYQRVWYRH